MVSQKRLEQLRKEHEELLNQLRDVYAEGPELAKEAPDGMPEALYPDEGEEAGSVPDPPSSEGERAAGSEMPEPPTPDDSVEDESDPVPTPDMLIYEREAGKATRRRQRLHQRGLEEDPLAGVPRSKGWDEGGERPDINVDDAEEAGVRDPERDDLREMSDVAFNMREYNRQLVGLLGEMQEILLDGIAEMETMRTRFHRMR